MTYLFSMKDLGQLLTARWPRCACLFSALREAQGTPREARRRRSGCVARGCLVPRWFSAFGAVVSIHTALNDAQCESRRACLEPDFAKVARRSMRDARRYSHLCASLPREEKRKLISGHDIVASKIRRGTRRPYGMTVRGGVFEREEPIIRPSSMLTHSHAVQCNSPKTH